VVYDQESGVSGPNPSITLAYPPIADYRGNWEGLLVSADASVVAFGFTFGGISPANFSLIDARLFLGHPSTDSPIGGWTAPRLEGLQVTDWKNDRNPKLRNQPLLIREGEISRCLAIAQDNSFFLLGSDWYLRCFGADGQERWWSDPPSSVWAVNLSADGRYVVAAYADGTIRWHTAVSGRELLAFFPHADQKRWVLWTPEGYFDCSEGGQDLIGWHLNQGKDKEAVFYNADQLWDSFHRPDIVQAVLKERRPAGEIAEELGLVFDLKTALRQTPRVALHGPSDGSTSATSSLTVRLEAQDTGGGLHDLALYHNGKRLHPDGAAAESMRDGLPLLAESYIVTLEPGRNLLRAQAANDSETLSQPAEIVVHFHGEQATADLHLLAVGLNEYLNPQLQLTYCVPDASAIAAAFQQRAGGLYQRVHLHSLNDTEATKPKIAAKFAELAASAKPQDVFVFAYAGHGVMGEAVEEDDDPVFYLVPHDVTQLYGNPEELAEKAVSRGDLEEWCAKIPARKQLMLLDTCQSGGLVDNFAMRGAAEQKAIAQLARSTGTVVIASTGAEAFARESAELGHGIFTKALLDGLAEAKADANKDGRITVKELEVYINEAVPELSQKLGGAPQFPTSYSRGQDFPVGVVR
jgi:hypothetical protein